MNMGGPLPPGIKGGMVGTTVSGMGPPLLGSVPASVCVVAMGPLEPEPVGPVEEILVMMGGKDTCLVPTIPLWKGSGCTPAMGLDGVVNKAGLD